MPNRIIKQSAFESEKISALSDFEFRVWVGLITQADDAGRGDARPAILKGRIFPLRERVTVKDIDAALRRLAAAGCVSLYTVGGKPYFEFPNWAKHQRVYNTKGRCPGPEEADGEVCGAHCAPLQNAIPAESCGELPLTAANFRLNPNPNPNKNPNPNPETNARARADVAFERFWEAYPKKVGKVAARKAWEKIYGGPMRSSAPAVDAVVEALERQTRSEQWTKEGGRYIPNPATWLNQGRWEDELEPARGNGYQTHDQEMSAEMQDWLRRSMEGME